MLNDDFDLFKVEQEVIYDSAIEGLTQEQSSIRERIQEAAGNSFLKNCFRD